MANNLGDFDTSAVIYGKFSTYRPSTGAAFTLGGTPAISVYKDNSTTQSTTGVTLTADFDSVTGLNHFAIDTSADGTFYSSGSFFDVVITTGTVDSVSVVGSCVGQFTLRKTAALKPTTAGRTLDVSAGGEAGLDWANVGSPTTSLALTGTTIAVTQKVDVDTIKTNPVVNGGTITFPTGATLASTTNITGGTITTTTNLTNLPSIPNNWLTAAGIAASALNGKGDWLLSSSYTAPTNLTAAQIATGVWQDTTAGDFTVSLSVGKSIMNGVALGTGLTVNDITTKTGYSLTQTFPSNFSSLSIDASGRVDLGKILGTASAGAVGYVGVDWGAVTNKTTSNALTGTTISTSQAVASVSGAVGSVTGAVGSISGVTFPTNFADLAITVTTGKVTVGTNSDKTGYELTSAYDPAKTAAQAGDAMTLTSAYDLAKTASQAGDAMALTTGATQAVWDKATTALTTAGSIGKRLADDIDAAISTRSTYAGGDTSGTTTLLSRLTGTRAGNLDNLDAAVTTRLASASYTAPDNSDIVAIKAKTDNLPASPAATGDIPSAAAIAGAVWDEALSGHTTAGTAGEVLGTNLDATVSSRLATSSYTAPDNADILAIKAKTDNLPASPAAVSDIPTANQNADALLDRDLSVGTDSGSDTVRTLRQGIRINRNKVTISGGTMTVMKEDDATPSHTSAVTTDAAANPIVSIDPAGP